VFWVGEDKRTRLWRVLCARSLIECAANRLVRSDRALIPYLPAYSDRKHFLTLDGDAVRRLGVILFVTGSALGLWLVFVLGGRFSGLVAIQPGRRLVTAGIYGVIRHPNHLGLLVSTLG
jgi:hypothetical protein